MVDPSCCTVAQAVVLALLAIVVTFMWLLAALMNLAPVVAMFCCTLVLVTLALAVL
jgi:hypothetical protein